MKNKFAIQEVAKQYNISPQEIIDFLNDKGVSIDFGYQKIVDPKIIRELEKELMNRNKKLPLLYISDADIENFKPVTKPIEFWQDANIPNLEKLIYKTLSFEKPKSEKIVGLTPFKWKFIKAKYNIKYSVGLNFTLFEDTICEIVKIKPGISVLDVCQLLGFGNDQEIISETVKGLKTDSILQVDDNWASLHLTEKGSVDIQRKQKSKPATNAAFDLFIDYYDTSNVYAKEIFSHAKSQKSNTEDISISDFELIKNLAEFQQPTYQSSKSGYILQDAELIKDSVSFHESKFVAIVTEDLANNIQNKIWIFDPYKREISKQLTKTASENTKLYGLITEKLFGELKETVFDSVEKDQEQIDFDNLLVNATEEKATKKSIPLQFQHFLSPDSLDTVQFEDEMERLFEVVQKQLWLIFPFAMGYIIEKRIRLIEKAIKNECSVFVCFSQNENREFGAKAVIDKKALEIFNKLANDNEKFYYAELPKFHEKRVFAFLNENFKCEYSGSHNYLSFFVQKTAKGVRRENMQRLIWSDNSAKELAVRRNEFAFSYCERISDELNADIQLLSAFSKADLKGRSVYYKKQAKKIKEFSTVLTDPEMSFANVNSLLEKMEQFIQKNT
jgi:hypothetical protein